jgi:hypothetical protein
MILLHQTLGTACFDRSAAILAALCRLEAGVTP